jgi:uncharacterized membrane protein
VASEQDVIRMNRTWPWWRWMITGLCILGLALSAYLAWHHLTGGAVIGCSAGNSCDQVLKSRWSSIGGLLPVSGLAVGTYLALLIASFFIGPTTAAADRKLAWGAMLVLVTAAAGCAIWFILVQKLLVGAFCPYCMATHITGLLLAALVLWQAPRQLAANAHANAARLLARGPLAGFLLTGLTLAGLMATTQALITPPSVYRAGESQSPAKLPTLNPHEIPLLGSPDAPNVVTLFFDYKCPHCQRVHAMLDEVIHRYDGKIAFALCPAPLNRACNPYVQQDVEAFKDSCDLAKIGVAVWIANREAFPAFDRWMFSPDPGSATWRPRTLEAARAKAIELIGPEKFDAARADPRVDAYMQTSIELFGGTILGGNAVPKLLLGTRWVSPEPNTVDDLVSILQDSLGVPRPERQ